jgi:hypothetical protein
MSRIDDAIASISRIEASIARIETLMAEVTESSDDHENRLRWLERAIWIAAAAAAGSGSLLVQGISSLMA